MYDRNLNITPLFDWDFDHNKVNEITGWDNQSTEVNPTYDAVGNLTDDKRDWKYTYDAWYRLVEVRDQSNNLKAQFRYNGLGFRIAARYDDADPWYHFAYDDRWRIVAMFEASDTDPTEQFWYQNAGASGMGSSSYIDEVVLRDRDTDGNGTLDERLYYCQNWHHDVVALCDTSGSISERVNYDAYGSPIGTFTTVGNRKGYAGYEYDAEIGDTYHVRYRSYRSDLGLWTTRDPLRYMQDTNLMAYSAASPINKVDPTGSAWTNFDFAVHYLIGGGVPITLGGIGRAADYESHPAVLAVARDHRAQVQSIAEEYAASLMSLAQCCGSGLSDTIKGTLAKTISRSSFVRSYLYSTGNYGLDFHNFWFVDWTFSIGGHRYYTNYSCNVSAYCVTPGNHKCYSYSCDLTHRMFDIFSDPFDAKHIFGFPLELEYLLWRNPMVSMLSGPFKITHSYAGQPVQGGQCVYA